MNILNGKYTIIEAEKLLNSLIKMNSEYQTIKTNTTGSSNTELMYSEHQILMLKNHIKDVIDKVKKSGAEYITLHSKITIEHSPGYNNA